MDDLFSNCKMKLFLEVAKEEAVVRIAKAWSDC